MFDTDAPRTEPPLSTARPEHGGRLRAAAARYGIEAAHWLDLSTGINPQPWPVPTLSSALWSRLPEDDDALLDVARRYYGTPHLLATAGSQAALQALPRLRAGASRVGVLTPGYAEHAYAWQRAGHAVEPLAATQVDARIDHLDVVVLIHPNNPTGARWPRDRLLDWQAGLAARGGWLLVDEAFMDVTPQHSLAPLGPRPGLIVLRSLGKFFGLAGARVGFVTAQPALLQALAQELGPWTLSTPARWLTTQALADHVWHRAARSHLLSAGARLADLLRHHGLSPSGGCALFQWVRSADALTWHQGLARLGILTRYFAAPAALRFGLPGTPPEWDRLAQALRQLRTSSNPGRE